MKIIISPAKKMNETDILPPEGLPHFLEQTDDAILRFPFAACAIGHVVLPRRQGASCP